MKRMGHITRHFARHMALLLAALLVLAALLAACQPTPEEDVVVNKGDGTLEEAIAAEALPPARYEAPETLRLDPFGTETFEVVVDAEVCVPDVERYPIVEVMLRTITADWARDMMYKMADGKTIHTYQNEVPTTKEQIEAEIALLQQQLANPDAYLPAGADEQARAEAEREWREVLEAWEVLYREAPDTFERREVDMSDAAFRTALEFRGAVESGKQRETYLSVTAWYGVPGGNVEYNNLVDVGMPFHFDMDSDLTDLNDVTISAEEAVQIGLDFLAQLGETDFAPAQILAGYCDPEWGTDPIPLEEWPQCYQIQFTRSVAGVPATYREEHYDGIGADGRERYAPAYPQESIEMDIRDSGVTYMYWSTPSELGRTLNENVTLMPFEQVVERFCDQILYSATPAVEETDSVIKKTLYIDRIELGMVRALQRGSVEEWVMVPAWTFFGRTVLQYAGPEPGGYPLNENNEYVSEMPGYSYLILNAVDGSVYDPGVGY